MKDLIKGGIITLLIGGSAYTINQSDVVKNFADDTGLTQEQAEQYVNQVSDDDLIAFDKLGSDFVKEGQEILTVVSSVDCSAYEYEWQSVNLTCQSGKEQMGNIGRDSIALGNAYIKLGSDSASKNDIAKTITLIDRLNFDYTLEIAHTLIDPATLNEIRRTNSYNKALLKTALESE